MLLLPFLEQTGLFSFRSHYQELAKGYYYIDFIVLFLSFMYLRRIKNPEKLKYHSPGEFGKIMGLDRVPEAKCFRGKLAEICSQQKNLDKANHYLKEQAKVREELKILEIQEKELLAKRTKTPSRMKIKDMPEHIKYTKLNIESKRFQNTIKMICYRAETSFANQLALNFKKDANEKRALAKSLINSTTDILPDYANNKLNINIYSQANPRMNLAIEKLIPLLNECETVYPGTNLILNYQIAT